MLSTAAWFVTLVSLLAANIPFANQRLLACLPLGVQPGGRKSLGLRLLELIVLYSMTGLFAWWMEQRIGNVFAQGWEFYAITASMFLVFAFPGFVFQYLFKRH